MNLVLTVLQIVAPVFILAAIGFVWIKAGFEYKVDFVTRLAMMLSIPCLIFTALQATELSPAALSAVSLASISCYIAVTLVSALVLRIAKLDQRTYLSPMIFGNTGNLGLPLALFAFGDDGLGYAVVVFAAMAIWNFTFGVWILTGGTPTRALKEPLLWATILGAIFLSQGWHTPVWITNTLELVGQLAIPLLLITLGVAIARLTPGRLTQAVVLSVVKLVLCVALAWGVGLAFGLEGMALSVLVIQIATPVAVTSYLLAEKYGTDPDAVAGLVVISTVLSVPALPVLLYFLL